MALAKYYEDNYLIADERLRDMEDRAICKPMIKNKSPKRKVNRHEVFCPKRGVIDIVKRGCLFITMEFHQHLFDEQIDALKENGWKWNHRRKCWYIAWSLSNYDFAFQFAHGKPEPDCEADDVYLDGYSRITGKRETHDKNCPTQRTIGVI